jgi:predicted GNAT family N-acyltransferase
MNELEANLRSRGFANLVLHARASAVGFYEALGYAIAGDEFLDVTVPHFKMIKVIAPTRQD